MELEREIRDLAARRDIHRAIMRYMRGQDRLDPALQRSAFHDDADVDCGLYRGGPDGYTEFAQGTLAGFGASQHLIGQVDLEVDAEAGQATGEVYFLAWHRQIDGDAPRDLLMAGRYIDEYSCKDGRWAIQRRRELIDWTRLDPAADQIMASFPDMHLGARRGADFSQTRDWDGKGQP